MDQKNLNIFVYSPLALENGRGGEISSMELASGLQKYYNVTLMDTNILMGKSILSKEAISKKLKGLKKSGRFKFATLHIINRCFDFPYPWEILKLYKKIKKNDIIYASYHNIKVSLLFIIFSLLDRKAKFIIGYRKPLYSTKLFSLYNFKYRLSILLFSIFKRRFYHHTLSYNAKLFLDNFYQPERVYHITHGIELTHYIDDREDLKNREILNFIYIGYLDDVHKGIGVLINAIYIFLKENKNFKVFFDFYGMGPLEYQIQLLEKKYPNHIKFHGYISNDKIPDHYKKGDIYLFSSRVEPFPRSIMEALGAKLIILCSKTFGSIELLKGKEFAFFFRELTPEAIKDKMVEIYNLWVSNQEKFIELQNAAKEYVFNNHTSEIELNMFKDLINKISEMK